MKFSDLLGQPVERDFEVKGIAEDSRKVQPGDVFVWDSRVAPAQDAAKMAADAMARGAAAVVSDVPVAGGVMVADAGTVTARYAAHAWPKQPPVMLGVTGTSGKTSVVWFGRQLAQIAGRKAASVGTLGVMRRDADVETEYTGFTSPTALKLGPILDTLAQEKTDIGLLEVSSHALVLGRVDAVRFRAAGLTNITQDHLDFHGDLAGYHAAKLRLFSEVLPEGGVAVLNINRREVLPAAAVAKQRGCPVLTVGTANAELVAEVVEASGRGLQLNLKFDAVPVPVRVPLIGTFQAENLAVAMGLLLGGGMTWADVAGAVNRMTAVPGRMEVVPSHAPQPSVVVDYAHKPDALQRALESLRPLVKNGGKLRVVFGCGGNRDATKRPIMGKIAAQLADVVYVTDDNPRKEVAAEIRAEVMAGVVAGGGKPIEFDDRAAAIAAAIADGGPEDVVLIAGKGHESGQIVGDTTLPFDDRVVARDNLAQA
ncbi:MAG: UDP-N-acetylmuramoyl-L-alanyl-D-glutamate--2,6-diaminopimelate ligase [Alphaproteobacteria bacterium]|nr:MAG: UDP-N-acetylmuramoyl-L-alanyl-D-glutamate--2,6-diaminopimelate ligase [Alphaproteobacteria bacterium]